MTTLDLARRTNDFGVAQYFPSHEPWVVPEPMTLEPFQSAGIISADCNVTGPSKPDSKSLSSFVQ